MVSLARGLRRLLAAVTVATAAVLATAACASPGERGLAEPLLQGQWQLASAMDAGGQIDLQHQAITLTISSATNSTGRSSCSNYRAQFLGTTESLWVTATLPRHIDCGSLVQQVLEQRYITALNYVRSANVNGGDLDLLAPGIDLHYVRALFVPTTFVVGHIWDLVSLTSLSFAADPTPPFPEHGATIQFFKNNTLRASTACSTITAHFIQDAGQVVADHVVVQQINHCNDYNQAIDDDLVRLVDSSFSFTPGQGGLELSSPREGIALGFVDAAGSAIE
jgi:heat shock protein HslJ